MLRSIIESGLGHHHRGLAGRVGVVAEELHGHRVLVGMDA